MFTECHKTIVFIGQLKMHEKNYIHMLCKTKSYAHALKNIGRSYRPFDDALIVITGT